MALGARGPDWLRWTLTTVTVLVVSVLVMAILLGPVARHMAGERGPLSARDREGITVKDRIDAVNSARATLLQAATGLVVVGGLVFTGAGLVYTARTLDVSTRTLDATREGQVTDRYTKAVEQLGSSKIDVRLGGIYALQRLTLDSARDKNTIIAILIAYVRVHAQPSKSERIEGQAMVDVAAALNVISRLDPPVKSLGPPEQSYTFNLAKADLHGLNLAEANLSRADLRDANLSGVTLFEADMRGATLFKADLRDANLTGAYLIGADLREADLREAGLTTAHLRSMGLFGRTYLSGANLSGANLSDTDLSGTILSHANLSSTDLSGTILTDADLSGADLTGADLTGADLTGADLTGVTGKTSSQIKEQAKISTSTIFD